MQLLTKILSTLPFSQRRSVEATMAELQRAGVVERKDLAVKRRNLLSKVEEDPTGPTFVPVSAVAGTRISSAAWNGAQERLYSDLVTLYDQIGEIASKSNEHGQLTHSNFTASRLAILKLIEQMRVYQFLKANPAYQDVRFLSFLGGVNDTLRRPLAVVDAYVNKLELPTRQRDMLQSADLDLRRTTVTTTVVGEGLAGGLSKEFKTEHMLDADPDTFWGELVLADAPVRLPYVASWGMHQAQGMVVEVDIDLNTTQRSNNLRLQPFGDFPLRVIDVAYKAAQNEEGWTTVPGFVPQDATLGWLEFDFQPVDAAVFRVVLEQANYTRKIYHLPQKAVENIAVWEQVLDKTYDRILHQVSLTEAQENAIDAEPEELAVLNMLDVASEQMLRRHLSLRRTTQVEVEDNQIQSLGMAFSGVEPTARSDLSEPTSGVPVADHTELVEVAKYEYVLGIRQVEIANVLYQPRAFYASPKLAPGSTVLEVGLETTEEHVEFSDAYGPYLRSSVEYDLEISPNRRYAILPEAAGGVSQEEMIDIDRRTRTGKTRLPIGSFASTVRKNGVRLGLSDFTLTGDTGVPGTLTIDPSVYDPNAIYTATYVADDSATTVDLRDVPSTALQEPEVHLKTDSNNRLELNYYPYVNYEVVNDTGVYWSKPDEDEALWRYSPSVASLTSADGSRVNFTTLRDFDVVSGDFGDLTGVSEICLHAKDGVKNFGVSIVTSTSGQLSEDFDGDTGVDLEYEMGECLDLDGQIFGLQDAAYEPVQVFVNDEKAVNITAYETFEHPAFLPGEAGRRHQFIHAGRYLYFNTPISDAKIEVYYRWKTQYLRLLAQLRSNFPIFTEVTPKVVDATLKLKTTRL